VILNSTYVFYGDIYFVWNFLIKATTLILIAMSFGKKVEVSFRRIVLLAGMATIMELIGLCILLNYTFFLMFVNLLEVPLLVYLLLERNRKIIGKGMIRGYVFTIIINGVLEILWNQFGKKVSCFVLILVSCICVLLGGVICCNRWNRKKGVFTVVLKHVGNEIEIDAFYDSGNCLKDPYTGKGVHIISENLIKTLESKKMNKVLIPYHAIGTSMDLIEVVYIDEIVIYGKREVIKQHKMPLGIAKEEVFLNKSYKMILNEEVF